jgi:hypothetical protein
MNIKIINKGLLIFGVLCFSSVSFATCPTTLNIGGAPVAAVPCTDVKTISGFSGQAESSFSELNKSIKQSGDLVIDAVKSSSQAEIKIMSSNNKRLIEILGSLNGAAMADDISRGKLVHEAKMDYMLELQDTKMKAEQSVVGVNTTPEELRFIVDWLKNNPNNTIEEHIKILKVTIDDKDKEIPVKIKAAEGVCDEASGTTCAVMKRMNPGKTTEILYEECSREKRVLVSSIKQQKSITKINSTMQKSQAEAVEVENTTQAAALKLIKQRKISCSPEEHNADVCGDGISSRAYAKAIVSNELINNGNISASNFYNPPMVGSIDGSFEGFTERELRMAAESNIIFEGNESRKSTPPLVTTYKNSNQYLSAIDMSDNILNEAAVANQPLSERKNLKNSEFQVGYLSRMASLSLSKYSLQNSINDRLGSNVQNATEYDRKYPIKETFNGAGTIDQLTFDIENDYKELESGKAEEMYEKNEKSLAIMMLDAQLKQNKLVLAQILRNERIELLLATILSNEYNSPDYTSYLNSLRGQ